jgi:predicted metallopeptidase
MQHQMGLPRDEDLLDALLSPKGGSKKAEYSDAPEVQELADSVIEELGLMDASMARIKYLFLQADKSKDNANIALAGTKWKHLTGYDFVVVVWESFWMGANAHKRRALLYHELLHVERSETKKGTKWSLRKHYVEAFPEEVQQFGTWSPQLQELAEIISLPGREQLPTQ